MLWWYLIGLSSVHVGIVRAFVRLSRPINEELLRHRLILRNRLHGGRRTVVAVAAFTAGRLFYAAESNPDDDGAEDNASKDDADEAADASDAIEA